MGFLPLDGVGELNVVELAVTDNGLLVLDSESVPGPQVVLVVLHNHVGTPGELGIFRADKAGLGQVRAHGVCRAVDKAQQVPVIEVAEPTHLVLDGHRGAQRINNQLLQFEDEVGAVGPNVEENVTGSRDSGVFTAFNLCEGLQLCWDRARGNGGCHDFISHTRSNGRAATHLRGEVTEAHRLHQVGHVAEGSLHGRHILRPIFDGDNQEGRCRS